MTDELENLFGDRVPVTEQDFELEDTDTVNELLRINSLMQELAVKNERIAVAAGFYESSKQMYMAEKHERDALDERIRGLVLAYVEKTGDKHPHQGVTIKNEKYPEIEEEETLKLALEKQAASMLEIIDDERAMQLLMMWMPDEQMLRTVLKLNQKEAEKLLLKGDSNLVKGRVGVQYAVEIHKKLGQLLLPQHDS